MAGSKNTTGNGNGSITSEGIDPVSLERRFGRLEAAVLRIEEKLDTFCEEHTDWGEKEQDKNISRLKGLEDGLNEVGKVLAADSTRWKNYDAKAADLQESVSQLTALSYDTSHNLETHRENAKIIWGHHVEEHKSIKRIDRIWDGLTSAIATAVAIVVGTQT